MTGNDIMDAYWNEVEKREREQRLPYWEYMRQAFKEPVQKEDNRSEIEIIDSMVIQLLDLRNRLQNKP